MGWEEASRDKRRKVLDKVSLASSSLAQPFLDSLFLTSPASPPSSAQLSPSFLFLEGSPAPQDSHYTQPSGSASRFRTLLMAARSVLFMTPGPLLPFEFLFF